MDNNSTGFINNFLRKLVFRMTILFVFFILYSIFYIGYCYLSVTRTLTCSSLLILVLGGLIFLSAMLLLIYRGFLSDKIYLFYQKNNPVYETDQFIGHKEYTKLIITTLRNFDEIINKQNKDHDMEVLLKKAELTALQSQINPHFFYNTMEIVRGLAMNENVPKIAEIAEAISSQFRYTVNIRDVFSSFEEEIQNVEDYLLIQRYRFLDRFKLIKQFEDEEIIMNIEIPKLIIQPVVENAIYHGLEKTTEPGVIKIEALITNNNFMIKISDNGVGMESVTLNDLNERLETGNLPEKDGSSNTGVALININERMKLYYGEQYGVTVFSTKGLGTTVILTFPYK